MTTTIVAYEHVDCPPPEVEAYLERFLSSLASKDGRLVVALRVPASAFGIPSNLALEKRVTATITYDRDADKLNRIVGFSWKPEGGGPYPSFSGTLVAGAASEGAGSIVSISGSYTPPGGVVGDLFDALIGRKIARATIRELLDRIRDGIEAE
jgi:hypothetical protein